MKSCLVIVVLWFSSASLAKNIFFYMEERPTGGCRGLLSDADTGTSRVFFDHELACPQSMKWDSSTRAAYFQIDDKFYSLPWKKSAAAKLVAAFDHRKTHPEGAFLVGDFWFSSETGKLRHAYLAPLSSFRKITGTEGYEVGFEDRKIVTQTFLGIGIPYMAVMVEWRDGKWTRIAEAPTTAEAGDTMGFSALPKFSDEDPRFVRLRMKQACAESCAKEKYDEAAFKKLAPEGVELYSDALGNTVVATVLVGDSVHTSPPVFFCTDKNCATYNRVEDKLHRQIFVAAQNGWVLIGYEYGSTPKTYLFKFPSPTPIKVLPLARAATWFPYSELWETLN